MVYRKPIALTIDREKLNSEPARALALGLWWLDRTRRGHEEASQWQADPIGWMRAFLGSDPWEGQVEIAESVRDNRRTSVAGCHAAGKDYITARIVLWYLHAFRPSMVITTGPSQTQVEHILWRELRSAAANARLGLLGRALKTRYEIAPDHYALGFKSADTSPDRFAGFHAKHALVVIDEGAGVADPIYEALNAVLTSDEARELIIGNPTSTSGRFFDSFHRLRELYTCIRIPASETPNIQAGETVRPGLITQQWIDEAITEHGKDSPYVIARVNAQFPEISSEQTLVPLTLIDAAHDRDLFPTDEDLEGGLDVARFGEDENALTLRRGPNIVAEYRWSGMDTMQTVGKVRELLLRHPGLYSLKVDVIGIGAGVFDRLKELEYPVAAINAGASSSDPEKWRNLRDEMWWNLKRRFEEGTIAGRMTERTKGQLSSVRYSYDSRHRMPVIEKKDDAKKRGIKSPDAAEALMFAFWRPPARRRLRVLA